MSFGSGGFGVSSSRAHPPHVSLLSQPGTRPGIRPVIHDTRQEEAESSSWFPVAFRPPAFASQVIPVPPGELRLPHGRPTAHRHRRRTPSGLPRSTLTRFDRVGCPLYPGDGGALLTGCRARPAPAALRRPVPTPRPTTFHRAGPRFTRHQRGFTRFTRPVCPSPVIPSVERESFGFPSGFAPRRYQQRTPRMGPGSEHAPGTTQPTSCRSSSLRVHSQSATSCRNGMSVRSDRKLRIDRASRLSCVKPLRFLDCRDPQVHR